MIGPKKNLYESNRRSIFGIRSLGLSLTSLKTFCAIMDLPTPVGQKTYDTMKDCLGLATRKVAEESMRSAVEKEIQLTKHRELTVSGDGTWLTPGFHSHQGAATVIGLNTGKVLDVATKNNFCKACSLWENKDKETGAYDDWLEQHKPFCEANHTGSSGSMEVDCILDIFKRSVGKYKVIYKNYIGDGDAKVYKRICEDEPYGEDFQIEKKGDINHVSKRMGKLLRDKKKELSRTHLSDGKTIGGKGRLTGAAIDMLSKYYGKAVRDSSTVEEMYDAIWATWKHKRSTDREPQHDLCPIVQNSWCQWQKAKANGTLKSFKHTNSLPPAVMDAIKSIYTDLSKEDLLHKCVGQFSQKSVCRVQLYL
ncbi:hypothetical protein TKK_0000212 [Trichogramma kaykai]